MSLDIKKRIEKIAYTLKHKKAYLEIERKIRGKNTLRGYLHDIDKPFLYLAFWITLESVKDIHRAHSKHHVENNLSKTRNDLIDTIIDWECARITKPDKPLNAYDTLLKLYPEYKDLYLPIIKEFLPEQINDSLSVWDNPLEIERLQKLRCSNTIDISYKSYQPDVLDKQISR